MDPSLTRLSTLSLSPASGGWTRTVNGCSTVTVKTTAGDVFPAASLAAQEIVYAP